MSTLPSLFGQIDIYLFDQLLRGRIVPGLRIFDAGCGSGRNLVYLLREGYEVFGADPDPDAIAAIRALSASLATALPAGNFHVEAVEATSFPDAFADVVISSAVLHFRARRRPLRFHAARHLAGVETRGYALLPPRILHRY